LAEKAFGDHPKTGGAHLSFARELLEHGEVAQARHHFERALELVEEHWGRESIQAGWTHEGLARAFAAEREYEAAVSHLEQAQRIRERTGERGKAYERNERLRCDYLSAMGATAEGCAQ
jgi:tetratricopeptide (TPR) repeat protein